MRALVTGAAGFIGSQLSDALLAAGVAVRGVDCFTRAYDVDQKHSNIRHLKTSSGFELVEADLRRADVLDLLDRIDFVFHHAAMPGVRSSWSTEFEDYVTHNVLATHRLLEASRHTDIERFVYASSSSVYGNALRYPTQEGDVPRPFSPYGVTKLAGENLCAAYAGNFGLPVISLRYFSVYGPRQRPDMAMHRLIEAALGRGIFPVYGSGAQIRDFTFVGDVVAANLAVLDRDIPHGTVMNIAGGSSVALNELIETVGELMDTDVPIQRTAEQPGDVDRTGGSIEIARQLLGWKPEVSLRDGLAEQIDWHQERTPTSRG